MQFINTFKMGFKYLWKDPVNVAVLTLFPIVIILLLGTALETMFTADISLSPTSVAVVGEPDGALGIFLQSDGISEFFELEFTSLNEAREMVETGSVSAAFIDGQPVEVLVPAGAGVMTQVALTIIDSYQQIGAAATIALYAGRDVLGVAAQALEVQVTPQPIGTRVPSAMDYFAVTMLVMILLFAGFNGMELFHKGLFSEMGDRMRLSPMRISSLVGGLMAASTVTSFIKGLVVFAFTWLVYGVYWGSRVPLVLVTLFGVVLLSQALCVLLFVITGKKNAVVAIAQVTFFVTTFISGGYMRVDFGGIVGRISQYVPNALAHTVVFGAIYGGDEAAMMTSLAILFGAGIAMMGLSFILGRRRLV